LGVPAHAQGGAGVWRGDTQKTIEKARRQRVVWTLSRVRRRGQAVCVLKTNSADRADGPEGPNTKKKTEE